ncbi:MAG: hypothetical protein ACE5I3_02835 [Phycisphaerae bacterium]
MAATQPRAARSATPFALPIRWQVFACATLCALGTTLGLITVLGEIGYHVTSPTRGWACMTAALCAGITLGLWIPRRIIRRRLQHDAGDPHDTPRPDPAGGGGLELEFAASLSGALIVMFALMWVVLCGGALLMEEYRAFLAQRFLYPIQLKRLCLSLPAYAGFVFAGATGTTLLVALHGWHRLVTQPNTNVARLWMSMLFGALAAGLLAYRILSAAILAWVAPLAIFVAGMIAVLRRSDAVGVPTPPPTQRAPARDELLSLLAAGLAAATSGTALSLATPHTWISSQSLAVGLVVLAGAALAGLLAARLLSRPRFSVDLGPLLLLLAAVALSLPYQQILAASVNSALVRLATVTGCAAACIVLAGRRVSRTSRSVQSALSWVGGFVAAGFGLALACLAVSGQRWNPSTPALVVSLVVTAGAGLVLILDSRAKTAMRIAGLVCIGLWLAAVPSAARALAQASRAPKAALPIPVPGPLVETARRLVTADTFRTARVRPLPPSAAAAATWQFDLAGPALDLVILERVPGAGDGLVSDAELGRRLLRRATTRLARGGRLLIELPTASFVAAALDQIEPLADDPAWTAYRLHIRGARDEYEALVFGADIPALIERHTPLPDFEVSLRALSTSNAARR